jgi:hypothetical protein
MPPPPADSDLPPNSAPPPQDQAETPADEDFYLEGPYLVFTAAYHLKRGYCCHSGCRHCPYGELE